MTEFRARLVFLDDLLRSQTPGSRQRDWYVGHSKLAILLPKS